MSDATLPYDVLVVDDQVGVTSWGQITKVLLEGAEFRVKHASSISEAINEITRATFDIIIIDLDLQSPKTGIDLQLQLRRQGLRQPVILVSGNSDFLTAPVSEYTDALSRGPVAFYDKRSKREFLEIVREASNIVDPIRRVLKLMKDAGLGDKIFNVDGNRYTVAQLLDSSLTSDGLVRALRESLYGLILELQATVVSRDESVVR